MTKTVTLPQSQWTIEHLSYWKKDNKWYCAVPREDWATKMGLSWKTHGLIGSGKTKKEALEDWQRWKVAADLVSDIY